MAFKDFKLHFKLEYDIKTSAYNMQEVLELINHNICKELDLTKVEIMPTVTKIELKRNIQCVRCINRKTRECNDNDRLKVRDCENFVPRTEETGFDN